VSFKNTVIVMTSNIGTGMVEKNTIGFSVLGKDNHTEGTRKRLMEALRQQFRPEFLNRIDDIIVFNTLSREHLSRIVNIQLDNVGKLLKDRKVKLEITTAARDAIIAEGFDPDYGARPMKRAIQRLIQDPLALKLINADFHEGDTILVDASPDGNGLTFARLVSVDEVPRTRRGPFTRRGPRMSFNTLKTVLLLGGLTGPPFGRRGTDGRPAGPVHWARPVGADELRQLFLRR